METHGSLERARHDDGGVELLDDRRAVEHVTRAQSITIDDRRRDRLARRVVERRALPGSASTTKQSTVTCSAFKDLN